MFFNKKKKGKPLPGDESRRPEGEEKCDLSTQIEWKENGRNNLAKFQSDNSRDGPSYMEYKYSDHIENVECVGNDETSLALFAKGLVEEAAELGLPMASKCKSVNYIFKG